MVVVMLRRGLCAHAHAGAMLVAWLLRMSASLPPARSSREVREQDHAGITATMSSSNTIEIETRAGAPRSRS